MTLALGTPAWCAPELIECDVYDEKATDVYAFGITIWEVLKGIEPFSNVPVLAITVHVLRGARPELDPAWPAEVRDLIENCWANEPAKRPTMAEVSTQLSTLADLTEKGLLKF